MESLGKIAVWGGGSWATALAKLLLGTSGQIVWYMRRRDRIDEFLKRGHNPVYLSDVAFDTSRIKFTDDINEAARLADTFVVAVPSPYFKSHIDNLTVDISGKTVVSAIKGIVPDDNMIVTDYFNRRLGVAKDNLIVVGGPCHAEEVALERLSYLTVGCHDTAKSRLLASRLAGPRLKTIISDDVDGIEYAEVLKNVYAIAAGIISGMKAGDNFMAMLVCNAAREMRSFIDTISPMDRDICRSAYLGDLLVTAYSKFSRNHNFGSMIGKGYSVTAAKMEMSMVAEGYYGTKCMHEINSMDGLHVKMPIMECIYDILYGGTSPRYAINAITDKFA